METCPLCRKPVMDHALIEALRCAQMLGDGARALMRQGLTSAEDTVDGHTWTRAAATRSALESLDQSLQFLTEALPELAEDER